MASAEKAIKCSGKRCKEVFHIYENHEPGGCNDYGHIAVRCKKCKAITRIRMKNPSRYGIFNNFEIIDAWEYGESNIFEKAPLGETARICNNKPAEGVPVKFKPSIYPLYWNNAVGSLEKTAFNQFKKSSHLIDKELSALKNVFLKSMIGFTDIKRCVVIQEYEQQGNIYRAVWGKELKYENTMNSNYFHLLFHSDNLKIIDGVYSRNALMHYLFRCLMKWKLLANQVIVVTPFIGFDFAFSKDEDKQELIRLWELLNCHLNMDKSVFITRMTSYSSLKKFQKKFDVPADVLAEWDLMNNLQRLFHDPKTRIKTKIQFHAKLYAGVFDDHVELLSGSYNVQTGKILEQMHLRNMTKDLFKHNYLDRLVDGFAYGQSYNPGTFVIKISKDCNVKSEVKDLRDCWNLFD